MPSAVGGRVVIGCGGEVIARHARSYGREDMVFDPVHCLPLIAQKIGASIRRLRWRDGSRRRRSPPCSH